MGAVVYRHNKPLPPAGFVVLIRTENTKKFGNFIYG